VANGLGVNISISRFGRVDITPHQVAGEGGDGGANLLKLLVAEAVLAQSTTLTEETPRSSRWRKIRAATLHGTGP
jgi:hypothetical protein